MPVRQRACGSQDGRVCWCSGVVVVAAWHDSLAMVLPPFLPAEGCYLLFDLPGQVMPHHA